MAKTMESWAKDRGYVYPHIRKVEGMCGGRPCIDGTRVRVVTIVFLQKEGHTPEQILEKYPDLNLAQVHAALTYYYDNPEEIDAYIAEDDRASITRGCASSTSSSCISRVTRPSKCWSSILT